MAVKGRVLTRFPLRIVGGDETSLTFENGVLVIDAPPVTRITPGGRITTATQTAVQTSDVASATAVYYTPCVYDQVPIYDGTAWTPRTFTELTQATTDTNKSPAAVAANSNYDLFVWRDVSTMRCTRGPAWTSGTARGTGAGTTELERIDGIFTNKVDITNGPDANRGTYVGTIRSNGSSAIDMKFGTSASGGGMATIGIWNAYNQSPVVAEVSDTDSSWTYQSATFRSANASATMRVNFICGLAVHPIFAKYSAHVNYVGTTSTARVSVALDSTSAPTYNTEYVSGSAANSIGAVTMNHSQLFKASQLLGFHFIQAVEATDATNANQFVGQSSNPLSVETMF